jgi:hypothetical protein
MFHRNDHVAVPSGFPLPSNLPPEFGSEVTVSEIIDSSFPCYVFAEGNYKLVRVSNSSSYVRVSCDAGLAVLAPQSDAPILRHGPAATTENACRGFRRFSVENRTSTSAMSLDFVCSLRCLFWPPQAAEWRTRQRTYNWPDAKTIESIVNNGCDVVQAAHPACRHDERMRYVQWRLSFSRAEIVLLNTWSVNQQLVYHMLRVFVKYEQSTSNSSLIHNYHIKTVMLWACEQYSQSAWNSDCLISLCTRVLQTMVQWLKSGEYPLYFVTECNLYDSVRIEIHKKYECFVNELCHVTDQKLSKWFIYKYISQCVELCPPQLQRLFNNALHSTSSLDNVLSEIIRWRHMTLSEISFVDLQGVMANLQRDAFELTKHKRSFEQLIKMLHEVDSRLTAFYCALCLVKIEIELKRWNKSTLQLVDYITMLIRFGKRVENFPGSNFPPSYAWNDTIESEVTDIPPSSSSGCRLFLDASILMVLGKLLRDEPSKSLVEELSKFYIETSLMCDSVQCKRFHEVANGSSHLYLACLCYSTGQYQTAIAHCSVAIKSMGTTPDAVPCIEMRLLPLFDNKFSNVIGLYIFYDFLHKKATNKHLSRQQLAVTFSTELFAHYLIMLHLLNTHSDVICTVQMKFYNRYKECSFNFRNLSITDILLFYAISKSIHIRKAHKLQVYSSSHECEKLTEVPQQAVFSTRRLRRYLMQYSVELLKDHRLIMLRDYGSIKTVVTTDYQAMYAYRCGLYQRCYDLCYENVNRLLYIDGSRVFPEVLYNAGSTIALILMGGMPLVGLSVLCGVIDPYTQSVEGVTQLTLSMYLLVQCKLRLKHATPTFIEVLRKVKLAHSRHHEEMMTCRSILTFVYRRSVRLLQLRSRSRHAIISV